MHFHAYRNHLRTRSGRASFSAVTALLLAAHPASAQQPSGEEMELPLHSLVGNAGTHAVCVDSIRVLLKVHALGAVQYTKETAWSPRVTPLQVVLKICAELEQSRDAVKFSLFGHNDLIARLMLNSNPTYEVQWRKDRNWRARRLAIQLSYLGVPHRDSRGQLNILCTLKQNKVSTSDFFCWRKIIECL